MKCMAGPERQDIPEEKSDSFFVKLADRLKNYKDKIVAPKTLEVQKKITVEQKNDLLSNKQINTTETELLSEKKSIELALLKKSISSDKKLDTQSQFYAGAYASLSPEKAKRVDENSSNPASIHKALAAQDLQNDIQNPLLSNLFS